MTRPSTSRRDFLARSTLYLAAATAAGPALASESAAHASPAAADTAASDTAARDHLRMMNTLPPDAPKVAMLIHPQMVALDLVGPLTVFKVARFDTQLVGKTREPVSSVEGLPFAPTHTFADCAADVDVLFVPGGIMGTIGAMNDPATLDFLASRGRTATWVTSVCTGGLLLGAAGLLRGYDATAHWAVADLLPILGARHVNRRVVTDRNRMTAGGVTAGVDFALTLVAQLKGEETARRAALTIEYAPAPPFLSGTPEEAGPERTQAMRDSRHWMDNQAKLAAQAAAKRLGIDA
ncbi:DJ-1/PfpI family protein [Burkholderia sp. Ac-20379]|uniref:DJ-1/PfpI family protein n=1 Tax=Burkholderia sp. Ac-20379 TaxID=2703900 RepID=UPI001DC669A7|nr:DJ-1/PfpI family protein [Burkholderia sp. Ac-20379]MBN3728323.1 DJ-1/PfpI family protein [Burkholderia sp. Ac-20379]